MAELQGSLFGWDEGTEVVTAAALATEQRPATHEPEDHDARRKAIDTRHSVMVQAPAGAGKTNLLTQRFLALLAEVEHPEQILAITFTRAATAEMRNRIQGALERAERPLAAAATPEDEREWQLARAAMRQSERQGWRLLESGDRLAVETIDSLCLRLAHSQPLLARLGGALQPAEDAAALYAAAARRTLARLGSSGDGALEAALETLLLRRDNNLSDCERLLAGMLAGRDAWLGVLPLAPDEQVEWAEVRARLEEPFGRANREALAALAAAFARMPGLAEELLALSRYAAAHLEPETERGREIRALADLGSLPGEAVDQRVHWGALASLLLAGKDWRKSWRATDGFPPKGAGPGAKERDAWKKRMEHCGAAVQAHEGPGAPLLAALCRLRTLPDPGYDEDQWATLLALFRVLRRAVAELRLVFAEANKVDFPEIAQAAEQVLRDEGSMRGLLESERKQHILIDEFQDTSRAQYRLVAELLREWNEDDGRTVFLVGDPLQSIYGFRQAEVALFHQTRRHGLPCGEGRRHPCHPLQLTHNFRSHQLLVEALNTRFAQVFAEAEADTFVPARAWPRADIDDSFRLHASLVEKKARGAAGDADEGARNDEARAPEARPGHMPRAEETDAVIGVLQAELPRIAAARAAGAAEYKVAVLVRARGHLAEILPALRAAGIPYRAVELEPLADRPEVHDLHALLRALLHPANRVDWLTVLRAPWCGLGLRDLHLLTGDDDRDAGSRTLPELMERRGALLSADGQARLARTTRVLGQARASRYGEANQLSLAAWVERTWTALGGPACVDANGRENADAFFRLLDTLEPSGIEVLRGDFAARLEKLCAAPDAAVSERFGIQIMTMHKAKGLGFEVVLLPGLDRKTQPEKNRLLAMLERQQPGDEFATEVLLAPVSRSDAPARDRTYCWVMEQQGKRDREERRRLFYVACTRARLRLHLFANVFVAEAGCDEPESGSLLAAAWPGLRDELAVEFRAQLGARSMHAPTTVLDPAAAGGAQPASGMALAAQSGIAPGSAAEPKADSNTLLRLPSGWVPQPAGDDVRVRAAAIPVRPLFARSEGSLAARARGTALHALLEQLTVLFAREPAAPGPVAADLAPWRPGLERRAERLLREAALSAGSARTLARELVHLALAAAADPVGRWVLAPHPGALSESTWQTRDADGNLRTLRVDRSFVAGDRPGTAGESTRWVVDYKTGGRPELLPGLDAPRVARWMDEQKAAWRQQLETYGTALRAAALAPLPMRYGLFFPEQRAFISWSEDDPAE